MTIAQINLIEGAIRLLRLAIETDIYDKNILDSAIKKIQLANQTGE